MDLERDPLLQAMDDAVEFARTYKFELTDDYLAPIEQVEAMPQNQSGADKMRPLARQQGGSCGVAVTCGAAILPLDPDNLLSAWHACDACGMALPSGGEPLDQPRDRWLVTTLDDAARRCHRRPLSPSGYTSPMSTPTGSSAALERLPEDDVIVLGNATWADYQRLLELRGERPVPRITYLEGAIELMTPSRPHESLKSMIGRLVEAWCIENSVPITPYGSWTHESKEADRGVEPDECYVLGDAIDPARCDLAIEVIWTNGGIDKVGVYRKLGVKELWIWKDDAITVYVLRDGGYAAVDNSELLSGLDLTTLLRFVDVRPMTRAVQEYRATLSTRP